MARNNRCLPPVAASEWDRPLIPPSAARPFTSPVWLETERPSDHTRVPAWAEEVAGKLAVIALCGVLSPAAPVWIRYLHGHFSRAMTLDWQLRIRGYRPVLEEVK